MRKLVSSFVIFLIPFAFAGCGNQNAFQVSEESTKAIVEESTSSYAELQREIEMLEKLLSDNEIGSNEERHPIDIALREALEKPENMSPIMSSITVDTYADMWKEEMERYLGLLAETLTAEHRKMLDANQKKWEAFIDGKNELEFEIVNQIICGGTMIHQLAASNHYDKYRDRALFLERLYNQAYSEEYQMPYISDHNN